AKNKVHTDAISRADARTGQLSKSLKNRPEIHGLSVADRRTGHHGCGLSMKRVASALSSV
ncbi:MAG: hypothetical protein ACREHG_06425, partial [Candidatus Saccharimonadales bacterium]